VFAERQLAISSGSKILLGPLQFLHFGSCGRRSRRARLGGRRRRGPHPDIALGSRVRPSRPQALNRIHGERQQLEVHLDLLDRFGRGQLVHRRDGENGVADVQRLVGQAAFTQRARDDAFTEVGTFHDGRQIVDRQNGLHSGHRRCRAGVDPHDAGVRHRAQEQLRKQHPVDTEVFRVFRLPGHFGEDVRRCVILANEPIRLVLSHGQPFSMR
jgi:hypothetical protein